ncbi:MAG: methyltransferase domain-containing protein [Acaryochloris sp. RU_4_1]|nr:methyltransferase domain-containing protein [Acaryochloris sp. RU_4_1]
MAEEYTPGYTQTASDFMAQRTAASHGAFLMPHLLDYARLLDCGCGPGSISCDFARILSSGSVTGIDREESQIELARSRASEQQLTNVNFNVGSIYKLPFPDSSFNVVFAHAIFEHISSPEKALAEILRVLEPGGIAAIRSPDWGGFIVGPEGTGLQAAIKSYADLQTANGGDIYVGRKLPRLLRDAGFDTLRFSATYDCYQSPLLIAEYLALRLADTEADALRAWSQDRDAFFAQAWCEILGTKNA